MRNAAAMLYCPNPSCQASNSEDQKFCQKCSTPLPRRYLWALGEGVADHQPGTLIAERYLCKQSRVFLDTKPGQLSNTYQELPEPLLPYLRLTSYQLHVPQIYDWLPAHTAHPAMVLLDQVPLYPIGKGGNRQNDLSLPTVEPGAVEPGVVQFFPTIASQWQQATPFRQLNWLWQIANLWQPLNSEKAAVSLLDPEIIRVEGGRLRLLELRLETEQPTLVDLGQAWLPWAKTAQPEVTEFLAKLCQGLIHGEIHNTELLVGYLDGALAQLGQAQTRRIQLATLSDQGPTRQRNEDACYPASGTQTSVLTNEALLIVCDGIGGHQGGDVASHLAINTLERRVKALDLNHLDSTTLSVELEKAVCVANDEISQRNDSEHRFDRQRMGTTVVMALARAHELYLTHVGDSRAYWITRWGCHQITLDDDVASREVRLGYSFYRQALHQPSSGSLVQALGMGGSALLYPTVQRFIPDEDSIFLLCSDGLSDNDRVEEVWESDILPLFEGNVSLTTVSQQLVEIANRRNGYDNVTVGLISYRIATDQPIPVLTELPSLQIPMTSKAAPAQTLQPTELVAPTTPSTDPTEPPTLLASASESANLLPLLLGIGLLLGLGGLLTALLLPTLKPSQTGPGFGGLAPISPATPPELASPPSPAPLASLEVGKIVQLSRSPQANNGTVNPPVLISRPDSTTPLPPSSPAGSSPAASPPSSPSVSPPGSPLPSPAAAPELTTVESTTVGLIPIGTVLEVLKKQNLSEQESWVELRVCSTAVGDSPELPVSPAATPPESPPVTPPEAVTPEAVTPEAAAPEAVTPKAVIPEETAPETATVPLLKPGQIGWIREAEILPQLTPKPNLTPEQQQVCF